MKHAPSRTPGPGPWLFSLAVHFLIVFGSAYGSDYLEHAARLNSRRIAIPPTAQGARATADQKPKDLRAPVASSQAAISLRLAEALLPFAGNQPLSADSPVPAPRDGVTGVLRPAAVDFDVVVLASSGAGTFPGADGILSARLVYTVYLRVGTPKDWVLQFGLPESIEAGRSAALVSRPVKAPYPLRILRPDLAVEPEVEYMLIHGIVSSLGRFEQLDIVGEPLAGEEKSAVLRALEGWELRPAKLDGAAVPVEILLIIPDGRT